MIFGPIMMIVWLIIIIVIAAAVVRWLQGGAIGPLPPLSGRKRAIEILEERFAKGEIDKDEFQERKRFMIIHLTQGRGFAIIAF
jgi:putative membrane protein